MRELIILMGPSGAGKTALGQELKKHGVPELVSHTTREPREGEVPGVSYYYVTKEEFNNTPMIESVEYTNCNYGTSFAEVERVYKDGDKAFVIAERHGVEHFKQNFEGKVAVYYILAPRSAVFNRMLDQGRPIDDVLKRVRNAEATGEWSNHDVADYTIYNEHFGDAVNRLLDLTGINCLVEV